MDSDWSTSYYRTDIVIYRFFNSLLGFPVYVFGIPLFFLSVLYQTARPKVKPPLSPKLSAAYDVMQYRRERRYSFLYEICTPSRPEPVTPRLYTAPGRSRSCWPDGRELSSSSPSPSSERETERRIEPPPALPFARVYPHA